MDKNQTANVHVGGQAGSRLPKLGLALLLAGLVLLFASFVDTHSSSSATGLQVEKDSSGLDDGFREYRIRARNDDGPPSGIVTVQDILDPQIFLVRFHDVGSGWSCPFPGAGTGKTVSCTKDAGSIGDQFEVVLFFDACDTTTRGSVSNSASIIFSATVEDTNVSSPNVPTCADLTATPTDTVTPTSTHTPTATNTTTMTNTPAGVATDTPTSSPTATFTSTPTSTATGVATDTPTGTVTGTPPTSTSTSTATNTATATPTSTATSTSTLVAGALGIQAIPTDTPPAVAATQTPAAQVQGAQATPAAEVAGVVRLPGTGSGSGANVRLELAALGALLIAVGATMLGLSRKHRTQS